MRNPSSAAISIKSAVSASSIAISLFSIRLFSIVDETGSILLIQRDLTGKVPVSEKEITRHQHHSREPPRQTNLQSIRRRSRVVNRQAKAQVRVCRQHIREESESRTGQHTHDKYRRRQKRCQIIPVIPVE